MTALIVVRFIHFLAIFVLFGLLVSQHVKLKTEMSLDEVKRIALIDLFYGLTALLVFVAGLGLWLWVGKPAQFYTANPIFHAKISLFIVIALLSIYPTISFLKLRRSTDQIVVVPKSVIMTIRIELLLLVIIPLLAVLIAQGVGLQ